MKSKYIKVTVMSLVVLFSFLSYCYLNYNLAPSKDQVTQPELEVKAVEEDKAEVVLTELSVFRTIGKKFIEVVTFVI